MIKTIIKLDNTEQEFNPGKLNRWGEWAAATLGDMVDWGSVVMDTVQHLPERVTSQELQMKLIEECLSRDTWSYYLMAGRLYAVWLRKKFYGNDGIPTVKALHTRMRKDGIMVKLNYSTQEYEQIEKFMNHELDLQTPHFALHHIRSKYALQNRLTKKEYETPQFVYMRMAMTLSEKEPKAERLEHVKNFYELFSRKQLSAPTPNYVNLGTVLRGFASCCLIASGDTGESLATGDFIANMMTQKSAGIGMNMMCRSIGDPVRNGLIIHNGKKPYIDALGKAVRANIQAGRGGAITFYYNAFDPEGELISQLRNPRSTEDKKNRDLHYALVNNTLFNQKAAQKGGEVFLFNVYTAPDLHAAFYGKDQELFKEIYERYEADPNFKKVYVNARDLLKVVLNEGFETGTAYMANISEINRHTPFKDPIYSSNLCLEITQPTAPYYNMIDLYSTEDHGRGEISTCSLAAIPVDNIPDKETYQKACYYALKMIDYCINNAEYAFPHLEFTAKQRMNAGVGIMGLATHLARAGLKYSEPNGKQEIHFVAERHMYHMIEASLRIAKERGNAPWIHKTKWPEGWLPIDTYNRNVDTIVEGGFDSYFNWEKLREQIIEQGGIAHSSLVAYMPGEASSKALGGANSMYPVRRKVLGKSDLNNKIKWAAPYSDDPAYVYELAYDIKIKDQIDMYAITQKFTDQAISGDWWRRIVGAEKISSNEMLSNHFYSVKMGVKTRYYINTETTASLSLEALETALENNDGTRGCAGGACSL
ncbi:putative ribonucleotide-diphosphate reductase subunit alpha, NrdA [Pseudomonas phage PhiPA3]|uniref:Ribonucleoside-diphosphate reductase n=1 Tax=Pseudomonas phage PhiPA3 TaxID=998086 RepID=F8SJL0_BPPA3|nr:putative ribonucleotide-diphosphate reductase subunit alpha, NrdA [Pseudomonas phage PhiPA3]AEH03801.1 putative ribonucleotide-diphosphate reductase subunit alpha, NrdA [Pseudomonas phage PhiPA3]